MKHKKESSLIWEAYNSKPRNMDVLNAISTILSAHKSGLLKQMIQVFTTEEMKEEVQKLKNWVSTTSEYGKMFNKKMFPPGKDWNEPVVDNPKPGPKWPSHGDAQYKNKNWNEQL